LRACSGPADGGLFILYIAIRCQLQPHLGPPLPKEERDAITWKERISLLRAGFLPFMIFFLMNGLFLMGYTSLVESSAVGALASMAAAFIKGRLTREVMENVMRKTLGISCMFMWIILAALCFGAVFDGLGGAAIENFFLGQLGLEPWHDPDPDAAQLPADGHVSRRHGNAGDRGAALCAAGQGRSASIWSGTVCSTPSPARSPT
jgi:TRAP-type mannitol/chloroaromatic compound transport system permease large subunit